jgi:2'-5' RNA ligase
MPSEKINLFLAALIDKETLQDFLTYRLPGDNEKSLRNIPEQDLHLTLGYLRGIMLNDVQAIENCFDFLTEEPTILTQIGSLSVFGHGKYLGIILNDSQKNLLKLRTKANSRLKETLPYSFDARSLFTPHVSIQRFSPGLLASFQHKMQKDFIAQPLTIKPFLIETLALMTRDGDRETGSYRIIKQYKLKQARTLDS